MPLKGVAKDLDSNFTAVAGDGNAHPVSPATSGTWSAASVTRTPYAFFTIDGVAVVHAASCTFTFASTDMNNPGVTGTSIVTWGASSTTLQKGSTFVLRDGDVSAPTGDAYGNKIEVHAANHLRSD